MQQETSDADQPAKQHPTGANKTGQQRRQALLRLHLESLPQARPTGAGRLHLPDEGFQNRL